MTGRPRPTIVGLPAYRPGKSAAQAQSENDIRSVKLSSNESPYAPVPRVLHAMEQALTEVNRYPDHRAVALRSSLANWLDVEPAQVTVGAGSVGLLQQLMLAYVDPGDEVVFPWRSFEAYPILAQLVGGVLVTTSLSNHTLDLSAVPSVVTARTKLVLLANPNNPTGTALTTEQIDDFLKSVPQDVLVVVDEAYKDFMDPTFGDSIVDLLPFHPNVVVLRSFSKTHGLAGVRVGYAVGAASIVEALDKTLLPFAVNSVAQAGCIAAIQAFDEIETRVKGIIAERERVTRALREVGLTLPSSQANFVYLPLGDQTEDVCAALERKGIVTRPFSGEGLRVTIGTTAENNQFVDAMTSLTIL